MTTSPKILQQAEEIVKRGLFALPVNKNGYDILKEREDHKSLVAAVAKALAAARAEVWEKTERTVLCHMKKSPTLGRLSNWDLALNGVRLALLAARDKDLE